MLYYILGAVVALIALLAIVVALRSPQFRVARSAVINAPPQKIFPLVNDFHRWQAWSPWEEVDPNLQRTYEGPASGVGAIYSWVGNKDVGAGRMTILESRPSELIRIKLEFFKPFKGTNAAEFTFQPSGPQTNVSWVMTGKYNFICRFISLLMNMDKMIGTQFEKGLAKMKTIAESA